MGHYNSPPEMCVYVHVCVCVCMRVCLPAWELGEQGGPPRELRCSFETERFPAWLVLFHNLVSSLSALFCLAPPTCSSFSDDTCLMCKKLDVTARKTLTQQEYPGDWGRFARGALIAKNPVRRRRCRSRRWPARGGSWWRSVLGCAGPGELAYSVARPRSRQTPKLVLVMEPTMVLSTLQVRPRSQGHL